MSTTVTAELPILTNAPVSTWFGVGGRADRLAKPATIDQLRQCLEMDPRVRILGDGANLLVADDGVRELVVSLAHGQLADWVIGQPDARGITTVTAGAGANLPKLINETVRRGLTGLENLGGIPASVGGAAVMNAGGKFGSTGDYISAVHALDRATGREVVLKRAQIDFAYRHSSLARSGLLVTRVEFRLRSAPAEQVREKLKEVMAYKKTSQPMAERSAGCCFKNPTLSEDLPEIGTLGTRISAGLLLDRAGCKGLSVGAASVSEVHANFIVAREGCTAGHVLEVMRQARAKVQSAFGVTLEPEVVIWGATL
jgi:UDP-N-acetylmuramate dehydrogenase